MATIEEPGVNASVSSIFVLGSDIYLGGFKDTSSDVARAGYWKNGVWNALTPIDSREHSAVYSLFVVESSR